MFKSALESAANVAMVVLCGVAVWMFATRPGGPAAKEQTKPPTELVSLEGAQIQGSSAAKVVMLVFSDFQCPYCSKLAAALEPVTTQYVATGKVLLAFRHLPIEQIHQQALPAAKAATCAGDQGKFWAAHDGIFKSPDVLKTDWQPGFSAVYGLDRSSFQACMTSPLTEERVRSDMALATKFSVRSTPTTFIGSREGNGMKVAKVLTGVTSAANIAKEIDTLLK